jgi:tetratricopeptide (TPR) repeat protein
MSNSNPPAGPSQGGHANSESSPAMAEAMRLLRAGDTVRAEEVMLAALSDAESRFGKGSPPYASASSELGTVLLNVGQRDRAIEAYRAACEGPWPADGQDLRDRLTYSMNLGQSLEWAGRLEEAEQALRRGLEGRKAHYGREHSGYAFGLEPLATLMLRMGNAAVALEMLVEVVSNFARNRHPRIAGAIALRAEAMKAAGKTEPPFEGLDGLPPELLGQISDKVLARIRQPFPGQAERTPAHLIVMRQVLADLVPLLERRLGEAHTATLGALAMVANVERLLEDAGDEQIRSAAIRRAIDIHDRHGRVREALHAVMGLAMALGDAGHEEQAVEIYEDALRRAERLGDPVERAQALRNFGLCLSNLKRDAEAERRLREAVDIVADAPAAVGSDAAKRASEILSRSEIALGTFLQHNDKPEEARRLLQAALARIDPAHPDAIAARGHLGAIETGAACGCGDTAGAMAEAFRQFVLARLPRGLLEKLDVELKDKNFQIGVHLNREPQAGELEQLNRVMNHALEEFKRRVSEMA